MIIEITEQDIKFATPRNPTCCPIALSLRRIYPDAKISVGGYVVKINNIDRFVLAPNAQDFVQAFDRDMPVTPQSLELVDF